MPSDNYKPGCCADKSCNEKTCMRLPEGATCGQCVNFNLCANLHGAKDDDKTCDYFPRRYND